MVTAFAASPAAFSSAIVPVKETIEMPAEATRPPVNEGGGGGAAGVPEAVDVATGVGDGAGGGAAGVGVPGPGVIVGGVGVDGGVGGVGVIGGGGVVVAGGVGGVGVSGGGVCGIPVSWNRSGLTRLIRRPA